MGVGTANLTNYNSARFVDRNSEISNAEGNKLLLSNHSTKINVHNDFITFDNSVLYQYRGYLDQFCVLITFPEKYWYKPELISYELYGTPDLWYLITWFNDYPSPMDMKGDTIRVFNPSNINEINNIINVHKKELLNMEDNITLIEDETLKPVKISSNRII